MIKSILVPTSGTETDHRVFSTALAVARPLAAHLDFYHVRLSVCEAAMRSIPVQFCAGPALTHALDDLRIRDATLSAGAAGHVRAFCAANGVPLQPEPSISQGVSADWIEDTDRVEPHLMLRARYSDLVVMGRPQTVDLMPYNLIEWLLMDAGRPVLIAPDSNGASVTGTVVVGWKESPEAARAVAASMPLLRLARRVVLVGVEEKVAAGSEPLEHLARQLAWHGISAETRYVADPGSHAADRLGAIAAEMHADMLVVGAYGHGPLRETIFGGVTRALIERADVPVFMMH
jgi:nucleotide-binding universal stress UspA family protein